MTVRILSIARTALVVVTLAALALTARFALASPGSSREATLPISAAPEPAMPPRAAPDSLGRIIAARDVFRSSRSQASMRFDSRTVDQPAAPPPQQSPTMGLVLVGILTGADPAALVDGVPGSETTRVLKIGDRVGDYRIRHIGGDSIVVIGRDTTWTLRVRTRYP